VQYQLAPLSESVKSGFKGGSVGKQGIRQTCVIPVSPVQKFERMGRQEGRTKLLNSSTTWRLLVFMVQSESSHFIRQIGNSCLLSDHGYGCYMEKAARTMISFG